MERKAIILHGMPEKEEFEQSPAQSNKHWLAWLQGEYSKAGIVAQTPELPRPYEPVYKDWKMVFESLSPDEETDCIGHSCGAGLLVRWLSENNVKVRNVVLIGPWLDPDRTLTTGFFDFAIDPIFPTKAKSVTVFVSDDDGEEVLASSLMLENISGIKITRFSDKGHFTFDDMKTHEFPELRDILLP